MKYGLVLEIYILQTEQHNWALTSFTLFWLIVVFLMSVAPQIATETRSIPYRSDAVVGCCVVASASHRPVDQFPLNMMMFHPLPLIFLLANCSDAAPPTHRVRKRVDCYVCEVLLQQQQLHPHPCTSFVHKSTDLQRLVHSHQTIISGSDG